MADPVPLNQPLMDFIHAQPVFFVATAPKQGGHINLSPKGMESLRVLNDTRLIWLNVTGSGNETAAHVLENGRMTLMFCAFHGPPRIIRIYGQARIVRPTDDDWAELSQHIAPLPGARQLFDVAINKVLASCGMGVPLMDFRAERKELNLWATHQGEAEIANYWQARNRVSLDGLPTDIK